MYARHLRAVERQGFLVVWDWLLSNDNTDSEDADSSNHDRGSSDELVSQEEDTQESYVPFKCIGVTRDTRYQDILHEVRDRIQGGDTVPVKMVQEPDNVFDSQAIAFQCYHSDSWQTIGYVVSEICDEVNAAINQGDILSVEFSWVKYKLWKKSPGYYACIGVTRKGEWSTKVKRCCSTFS